MEEEEGGWDGPSIESSEQDQQRRVSSQVGVFLTFLAPSLSLPPLQRHIWSLGVGGGGRDRPLRSSVLLLAATPSIYEYGGENRDQLWPL